MRYIKKSLIYVVIAILSVILVTMPSFAASTAYDGLEVRLVTDKESYKKQDNIEIILTVKNTNEFDVSDVYLESLIPDGYKLHEGSKSIKQIETLNAGETVSMAVKYIAEEVNTDGNLTNNESDKENINTTDEGNERLPNRSSTESPSTGDRSRSLLWILLMVGAVIGSIAVIARKKKSPKGLLSLFLSITMAGACVTSFAIPVEAAEDTNPEISLTEAIKVGDKSLQLRAIVKYSLENDIPAEGEISYREPTDKHIVLDEETGNYFVDNEILIVAKEKTTKEDIEKIISEFGGKIVGCIEITNDYQVEIANGMTASELDEIVSKLNKNEAIESAMPHKLYVTTTNAVPNDSKWSSEEWSSSFPEGKNWGVEAIDAMGAWDYYDKMSYVKVGVIDSMFDTNHEDLVYTKVWNNPKFVKNSHGTHVSGTIAAGYNNGKGITGVAPKVELYGYARYGNTDPNMKRKDLLGCMELKYALANLITSNCKVINYSMGLKKPNATDSAHHAEILGTFLSKLLNKGYDFIIVQSAGNASTNAIKNGFFSAITHKDVFERIIVVGAIGNKGSYNKNPYEGFGDRVHNGYEYADFSNYGNRVDVVAPGVQIYSTVPNDKYEDKDFLVIPWNGTSMAAPHVSGIAAMCFSVNPKLTGKQVKDIIVNSASIPITDFNIGGDKPHPVRAYKLVNAKNSVESALGTTGDAISPVNPSTGIIMGLALGYNEENEEGTSLDDVSVSAYRISEHEGNLAEYAASTVSDDEGNYELILQPGRYYLNIYKDGYLPFAFYDVTVTNNHITYMDSAVLIKKTSGELPGFIQGTVRNALTGFNLEGVNVRLRLGWDNKVGNLAKNAENGADAEAVTDSNGNYSIKMNPGYYTAELSKEGYVTGYVNIICSDQYSKNQDGVITPVISDNEYRVVLTWSSTPNDLDSHISGPMSTGNRFHVYYGNMRDSDNDETIATLDLDDTSSYGPETITLKKTRDGIYKYAVHDYTNRDNTSSNALSMSGAKVELYRGNSLIGTYHVPINIAGTVWNVFEIEGDTVRTINNMESNSNPSTVVRKR